MKTIKGQALPAPAKKALSSSSWSDEFVAYPALSEEHRGTAGVILQFLSEPLDIFLEVTGVEVFLAPHLLQKQALRHHRPFIAHQVIFSGG